VIRLLLVSGRVGLKGLEMAWPLEFTFVLAVFTLMYFIGIAEGHVVQAITGVAWMR
jgi:hypothetical protein